MKPIALATSAEGMRSTVAGSAFTGRSRLAARLLAPEFADFAARAIIVALFTLMAVRLGADFLATGRVTGLLLLASEALVVILTVVRRGAGTIDRSMRARTLTALSMIGPPLLRPASTAPLAPEMLTVLLSAVGLVVEIVGKMSLGRSFGLMPANRGVVSTGPYRLVRHPIYLGYLLTHVAFVAAQPRWWNVMLLAVSDTGLLMRAVCEEQTLAKDETYRDYLSRVRWRVLPGVF